MNPSPPDAGFYEPGWSVLRIEGPDAVSFVNNLSTADAGRLADGQACETLFTDVKGRVLRHAVACRYAAGVDVVVTSTHAAALRDHLDRYHIREELSLEVIESPRVIVAWGGLPLGAAYPLPVLGENASLAPAADPPGGDPIPSDEFHALRIAACFPLDGVDLDDRTLPQELGRDTALICFTKGCYLGQETVARIDALGRVNRRLVFLRCDPPGVSRGLVPGVSLTAEGRAVGTVTSVAAPAGDGAVGLAMVRREHAAPGVRLTAEGGAIVSVRPAVAG